MQWFHDRCRFPPSWFKFPAFLAVKNLTCDGKGSPEREGSWSEGCRFMWFREERETYLPDGRTAETFAPHRSCCTETCLDSRRKPGNSPPVGPANWSGCPLCSSSSPGTEDCNGYGLSPDVIWVTMQWKVIHSDTVILLVPSFNRTQSTTGATLPGHFMTFIFGFGTASRARFIDDPVIV